MSTSSKRVLALLATAVLVGCQQAAPQVTPFGATITEGTLPESALPLELTGGRPVPAGSYLPDRLIVELSPEADADATLDGFTTTAMVNLGRRFAGIKLPSDMNLAEAHAILSKRPGVKSLSLDGLVRPTQVVASPLASERFDELWAHRATQMHKYWEEVPQAPSANDMLIAVLDTGLDMGEPDEGFHTVHPEFEGRVYAPQNFTPDYNGDPVNVKDGNKHGTHVAGTIGARGVKVVGVAPDVSLMPLKVLGNSGGGSDMGIAKAMSYAMDDAVVENPGTPEEWTRQSYTAYPGIGNRRVRVMNMSLGSAFHGRSALYDAMMAEARRKGIVVVVAAGNDGSEVAVPGTSPHAVVVSSTSPHLLGSLFWEWLSGFSNRGDRVDLSAPGGNILSTLPRYYYKDDPFTGPTDYGYLSGTSMATPYVAGAAAMVIAKFPPADGVYDADYVDRVVDHLRVTSDDLGAPGKDPKYGYGRVNVYEALMAPALGQRR
ncbi:Intracellular serine protease [compost metagenome]